MNTALIISSYDGSEDLWNTLEQTYKKFWNDIELPIFLSTNHKNFSSNLFNTIKIGKEISWSDNLIKTLNQINQKYVLLTFDDLFLTAKIDNNQIKSIIEYSIDKDFNYVQLYRSISKGKREGLLFKKSRETKYRNSTIWSLWKKDVLLNLLKIQESAWEFEINGNIRSSSFDHFYSTRSNVIPFINGIVRGKWNPIAKFRLKRQGFKVNGTRNSLTIYETIAHKVRDLQFDFLTFLIHLIY